MGFHAAFKDVISVVQKAGNLELYRQLLDLNAQALDLQAENTKLKEENAELRKKRDLASEIVRHKQPYITLRNDVNDLYYCSHCWDSQQLLIQVNCHKNGTFECPHCKASGIYDNEIKKQYDVGVALAREERNKKRARHVFVR